MTVDTTAVIQYAMGNNVPTQAVAMINGLPVRAANAIGQANIIVKQRRLAFISMRYSSPRIVEHLG